MRLRPASRPQEDRYPQWPQLCPEWLECRLPGSKHSAHRVNGLIPAPAELHQSTWSPAILVPARVNSVPDATAPDAGEPTVLEGPTVHPAATPQVPARQDSEPWHNHRN